MLDNKMLSEFKDFAELMSYAESQHQKVKELEQKIKQLEEVLGHSTSIFLDGAVSAEDEETISRMQLARIKQTSETRELTLEEARKVEIYSKILNVLDLKKKKDGAPLRDVSEAELIKQITDGTEKTI